jgi:O-methyltransferase involved in polyketide biosynthesis
VSSQDSTGRRPTDVPERAAEPPSFDANVAHNARIYDYWLGGKDNYEADREAAQLVIAANPGVLHGVRANRAFLRRAVEYLTGEAGIRQFLDIGTGLPTAENTHEVAQRAAPESRIVYVDNDPIVLAHSRALLTSTPEGATAYIQADARDPDAILAEAAQTLDLDRPVALMILMVLMHVPDSDQPREIVSRLMSGLAPGSYLVVSDTASDIDAERVGQVSRLLNERMTTRQTRRSRAEFARYFDGLELVPPGLVPLNQWRDPAADPARILPAYAAVGRKP